MRDPFGVHRRRVRAVLERRARPGEKPRDEIVAIEREGLTRDYWVLTSRELLCVRQGVVAQHITLTDAVGEVTEQPIGVTIRVHSRQAGYGQMLATFRGSNELTQRLAAVLHRPATAAE
jgi:hypothetical protein